MESPTFVNDVETHCDMKIMVIARLFCIGIFALRFLGPAPAPAPKEHFEDAHLCCTQEIQPRGIQALTHLPKRKLPELGLMEAPHYSNLIQEEVMSTDAQPKVQPRGLEH